MVHQLLFRLRRYRRLAAAVALGLAAMLAASRLMPVNDTAVVVARHSVAAGVALTSHDVKVAHFPKALVPSGSLSRTSDAVGALPLANLTEGTPLTASMLRGNDTIPASASHVAFPLHVADPEAAALLRPGDHIMVFRRAPEGGTADVAAKDVVVLSTDAASGAQSTLPGGTGTALITVDVAKDIAGRLAGSDSAYTFALLRG